MKTLENNVIKFNDIIEKNKTLIISSVNLILDYHKTRSGNTYMTYKSNYEEFFRMTTGKEIDYITWEELLEINYEDVLEYRKELTKRNSNKTINLKIASISSLYNELYKINRDVDVVVVDLKPLPTIDEDNSYGSLTEEEIYGLFAYCDNLSDRMKPIQKRMFFKLAYVTAIRTGALLNLTWKDISKLDNNVGYVIKLKDKGKINSTPISNELYKELLEMEDIDSDRVFPTTNKSLSKILREYCEDRGIDREERNIVLHSIKKASVDTVYEKTGDILETARHAHHSGVDLIFNTYQGRNNDLTNKPSLTLFNESTIDFDKEIEKYTKEELINAIKQTNSKRKILEELSKLK